MTTTTGEVPAGTDVTLISFGYRHGPPPATAELVVNVQHRFHDPNLDPELRDLTALDARVRHRVRSTPGVLELVNILTAAAEVYIRQPYGRQRRTNVPVVIAVGCTGGRHRAPTIIGAIADEIEDLGFRPYAVHRDLDKPVLPPQDRDWSERP